MSASSRPMIRPIADGVSNRVARFAGVVVLFASLPIDGYPLGSTLLREFGARPTNLLLAITLIAIFLRHIRSSGQVTFSRRHALMVAFVALGIPALNLPVTIIEADSAITGPLTDWFKQYGMLVWGLTSYWLWRRLLRGFSPLVLSALICVAAVFPLVCFFGDITGSVAIQDLLGLVRLKLDDRPSGLNSEPSTYSAWVAVIWPIVLFRCVHSEKLGSRVFAAAIFLALLGSAFLSNARTVAVIVALQMAYMGYWVVRSNRGLQRLRTLSLYLLVAAAVAVAFAQRYSSLADADLGSNIGRIGSTVTAFRVSVAHPMFGVGIGQLKYFFAGYAPDFALVSDEILAYATGLAEYRASSFNLFVRFVCEFGFAIGLIFSFLVLRPILLALRRRNHGSFVPYAALCAIGGTGFWLSQDQYGYQPAILSLALLSNCLGENPRTPEANRD